MRFAVLVIAAVACATVTVGCGAEDSQGDAYTTGPVAKSELAGALAAALCRTLAPCCEASGMPVEEGDCESRFSQWIAGVVAAADESKYTYDPEVASDCVRAAQDADACEVSGEEPVGGSFCADAFAGTVPAGGECDATFECAAPAKGEVSCEATAGTDRGICVTRPTASEGDPCLWTCTRNSAGRWCSAHGDRPDQVEQPSCYTSDGLFCSPAGICVAQVGAGEPCESDVSCRQDLFCDRGTCRARLGPGQFCAGVGCGEGLFCKNGTCTPQLAMGAACEPSDECVGGGSCSDEGVCRGGGPLTELGIALLCGVAGG